MAEGFNVQNFKSTLESCRGLASSNKFLVQFTPPRILTQGGANGIDINNYNGLGVLSYFCKAASLPGIGILTSDVYRYGYGPIERKPYGVVVNDMMLMFYVDGKSSVRNWIYDWHRLIVNTRSRKGMDTESPINGARAYEFAYKEDYAVDVSITAYTNEGDVHSESVLIEAYPNFVGDAMMDWDSRSQLMIMPVSLTYRDWYDGTRVDVSMRTEGGSEV